MCADSLDAGLGSGVVRGSRLAGSRRRIFERRHTSDYSAKVALRLTV